MPSVLLALHARLGAKRPVAYIEAEYFGGSGAQAHALLTQNSTGADINLSEKAINDALAWLGVKPSAGKDRFDTVGLGLRRDTDSWLPGSDQ